MGPTDLAHTRHAWSGPVRESEPVVLHRVHELHGRSNAVSLNSLKWFCPWGQKWMPREVICASGPSQVRSSVSAAL